METSEPAEKAQHKFDGILLCSMGLNKHTNAQNFENLTFLGSFRQFLSQFLP